MMEHRDTAGGQAGEQPREKLVQDLRPAWQQHVGVPTLGHPLTVQSGLRQRVPFDDRHPAVRISQDAGREQSAHACAQHHRVVTHLTHLLLPPPGMLCKLGSSGPARFQATPQEMDSS